MISIIGFFRREKAERVTPVRSPAEKADGLMFGCKQVGWRFSEGTREELIAQFAQDGSQDKICAILKRCGTRMGTVRTPWGVTVTV